MPEHTGDEREYQTYLDEQREEEEHETMDRPLYIVRNEHGRAEVSSLADALTLKGQHGGAIYELLGTSVANKIEREDNLAAAVKLAMEAMGAIPRVSHPLLAPAYDACKAALAAHEAFLAECRALEPKEEENDDE